jgi:hypothetical protein
VAPDGTIEFANVSLAEMLGHTGRDGWAPAPTPSRDGRRAETDARERLAGWLLERYEGQYLRRDGSHLGPSW